MPIRVKFGDIIEIPTRKGFVYAQYTHKNRQMGALLRVLDGFFEKRPCNFVELANKDHKFIIFFPLSAAVNRRIFEIVAHIDVPDRFSKFPLFRAGNADNQGKVAIWWFWDGEKSWKVGKLNEEQYKMPIQQIVNDTALVKMIEDGWTPETDRER
jgi:hypothetical protein